MKECPFVQVMKCGKARRSKIVLNQTAGMRESNHMGFKFPAVSMLIDKLCGVIMTTRICGMKLSHVEKLLPLCTS
jgi:hypothetical protein